MTKSVALSDETFKRLQCLAEPLVDTIDTVILRLLDAYDGAIPPDMQRENPYIVHPFRNPPPLKHTRIRSALINSDELPSPNWNGLVVEILRRSYIDRGEIKFIGGIGPLNVVAGRKDDEGYRHYPALDLSIQGMAADRACRSAFELARHFKHELSVAFEWQNRPDAAFPGRSGLIVYSPVGPGESIE